ncbi:hypothetical protein SRHO_G00240210 [Serrasalmus rhombeus]
MGEPPNILSFNWLENWTAGPSPRQRQWLTSGHSAVFTCRCANGIEGWGGRVGCFSLAGSIGSQHRNPGVNQTHSPSDTNTHRLLMLPGVRPQSEELRVQEQQQKEGERIEV